MRKIYGIIVLTGPKRRSERNGGIRRPGWLVAFMRIRRVTDAWLSRCRLWGPSWAPGSWCRWKMQIPATFRERRLKEGDSKVLEHVFQQA